MNMESLLYWLLQAQSKCCWTVTAFTEDLLCLESGKVVAPEQSKQNVMDFYQEQIMQSALEAEALSKAFDILMNLVPVALESDVQP